MALFKIIIDFLKKIVKIDCLMLMLRNFYITDVIYKSKNI